MPLNKDTKPNQLVSRRRGWPEGSLFDSLLHQGVGGARLLSLDCSTLPLIRTL